jgi:hypothetical protein
MQSLDSNPRVVLRSHFNRLRALLAVALVVVAGPTVAFVILATDDDAGAGSATASEPADTTRHYGGLKEGGRGVVPPCPPRSCSP